LLIIFGLSGSGVGVEGILEQFSARVGGQVFVSLRIA